MFKGIDLYSDTKTKPPRAMKEAMMEAVVGDEQQGEDPTTKQLEETMAQTLGTSAAMFFPSATMCNQIAIKLNTEPGDEIIGSHNCHVFGSECGGAAFHAGVQTRMIYAPTGIFGAQEIRALYNAGQGYHHPRSSLLLVENTTNSGGGHAWPRSMLQEVLDCARDLNLKAHLDGSRIFNAMIASHCDLIDLTRGFDTVTVCFSKGLSCAMGAVLGFDKAHFTKVRRLKQLFGGALRQSGILAAACLYALKHHVADLAADHRRALDFAQGLANIKGIKVENPNPATNIVFFSLDPASGRDPDQFLARCLQRELRFSRFSPTRFRALTHRDIGDGDISQALEIIKEILA